MKKSTLFTSLAIGLAAGAAVGFILAPKAGKNARAKIADLTDEYADYLRSEFDEFKETMNERIESSSKTSKEAANKVKSVAEGLKSDLDKALN